MFQTLTEKTKQLWKHTIVVGIVSSLISSLILAFVTSLWGIPSVTMPTWVFCLGLAFCLWGVAAVVGIIVQISRNSDKPLSEEQLKIIDFLYSRDGACTKEELCKAAEISHGQDAIFFISTLCDTTGHLLRIKGRLGITQKVWATGQTHSQPGVPTRYSLSNKGRELAMRRRKKNGE